MIIQLFPFPLKISISATSEFGQMKKDRLSENILSACKKQQEKESQKLEQRRMGHLDNERKRLNENRSPGGSPLKSAPGLSPNSKSVSLSSSPNSPESVNDPWSISSSGASPKQNSGRVEGKISQERLFWAAAPIGDEVL